MNTSKSPSGDDFRVLTENRLRNFWGYGNLDASTWFVGMEEGLSDGAPYLMERFKTADDKVTVDMRKDMQDVQDHIRWFQPNAPIQSTWKFPIALYLYLKNSHAPSTDEIREYQALRLGDTKLKETAGLELMPLPSTKADESTWIYGNLGISGLSSRKEYLETYKPERVQKLRELLHTYRPSLVIMYSLTYLPDWTEVIGKMPLELTKGMYFAEAHGTV